MMNDLTLLNAIHPGTDDLTLESLNYQTNYNMYGVRRKSELLAPKMYLAHELMLPRNSIFHHLDLDDTSIGPLPDAAELAKYPQRILVSHITKLYPVMGTSRPPRGDAIRAATQEYRAKYRRLRPLNNFERSVEEENSLIVMNYSLLTKAAIYPASRFNGYYKWYNILHTYFKSMNDSMKGNARHHYFTITIPPRMPSRRVLNIAGGDPKVMSPAILNLASRPAYMMIIELWKWLSAQRSESVMGQIDPENYDKLNMIVRDQGRWIVINIGRLQEMIGDTDEISDDEVSYNGSTQMQREFSRFLNSAMTLRNEASTDEPAPQEQSESTETGTKVVESSPVKEDRSDPTRPVAEEPVQSEEPPVEAEPIGEVAELPYEEDADAEAENIEEINRLLDDAEDHDSPASSAVVDTDDPAEALRAKYEDLAESGVLTVPEYRRLQRLSEKTKTIKNPFGDGLLSEYARIEPEELLIKGTDRRTIADVRGVSDPSFLESSVDYLNKTYLEKYILKDVCAAALDIQRAGVIVQDMLVQEVDIIGSNYYEISLKVQPIDGSPSTLKMKVPKPDKQGVFEAGGVKYRMKHQRGDLPIRKINPASVALTSYYAKVFVDRSDRSVVNYPKWLMRQLSIMIMDDDPKISSVKNGEVVHHTDKIPRILSLLGNTYSEMTLAQKYALNLNFKARHELFGEKEVKDAERLGYTVCGKAVSGGGLIAVDEGDHFYLVKGTDVTPIGDIEEILELDGSKAPQEVAEFRLYSKNVPVGFALGYFYGLNKLIQTLNADVRRVPRGSRMSLEPHEYALKFADESLIFSRKDRKAMLVLAGFNRYHREISRYTAHSFDNPDVYTTIMEEQGLRVGFIRELDLAMDMFVDPITRGVLKEMGEPTSLDKLLLRATELLTTDWHPRENSRLSQRDKGYERFAGHVYSELARSVRKYRSRTIGAAAKIEMNPQSVWMEIVAKDASVFPIEESNPIRDIKEREDVTYAGAGGRSNRSMVKRTRSFTQEDLGLTSEATTDSGSTGVNFSLPANPNLTSLRGLGREWTHEDSDRVSSAVSTSMLLAPAADHDDAKRMNFISIQHSHGVASSGGRPSPFATGYDKVLAHRTGPLFSSVAEQGGKVTEYKEDRYIKILYDNGEEVKYALGREYGRVTGTMVPHNKVSRFRVGDEIKAGDIIAYHDGFFEPDPLDPTQVLWKMGVMAHTAFMERPTTYEDSCVVSPKLSEALTTPFTHEVDVAVSFRSGIRNLISLGEETDSETILCMLEDEVTRANNIYDDESLQTLAQVGGRAPRAEHRGKIERIEVYYHGDVEDMGPDLLEIVEASDRRMKQRLRDHGKKPRGGRVDDTIRFGRDPLDVDTAVIRFYITENLGAGEGDKGVVANQMKTVISDIMVGVNETEDGAPLDLFFSWKSAANRMVESVKIVGTTVALLEAMSQIVYDYHNEK